ncbi:GAF and ANTAR domain-containing protein [Marisediminicola sp. LYQ134]|uniref:GAF and ANTAR domain-containing protein n=1 Tax=unclassified Marisediminicola TaxID=2618316 RepID=UPI003982F2A5
MIAPFLEGLAIAGAAISIFRSSGYGAILASSDDVARRIEDLQFELGEGPGFTVRRTGRPVQIDTGGDPQYVQFCASVNKLGVGMVITLPLTIGSVPVGVTTLYRTERDFMTPSEMVDAATLVGSVVAPATERAMLLAARNVATPAEPEGELRREVHQATGMILAQLGCSTSDALLLMRAHAYARDRTMQAVAHDVVTRQLDFRTLTGNTPQ